MIAPVQPGSRGQVWRADSLGNGFAYLSSGLGNAILLSYGGCGANAVMNNSQQNSPKSGADGFQQWNFTRAGSATIGGEVVSLVTIGNPTCAGTLYSPNLKDPQTNTVLVGTGGSAPGNRWFPYPNYPLDTILNEPPLQFPKGTTQDQVTAYDYISSQLLGVATSSLPTCTFPNGYGYTGVRCQYTSAVANFSQYQATLTNMVDFPSLYASSAGVPVDTFSQVATQVQTEVDDVVVVDSLFSDLNDANQDLGISESTGLNLYLTDALGSTTAANNVKGTTAAVLNGILYTVLSAGPGPLGVFANLMETGINATEAATQGSVQLGNPFQVAANALWTQLNTQFLSVLDTLADMQTAIVTDWGYLQNVAALTKVSGPGSLNWQDDTTKNVTDQANKSWAVTSMQMLLPARYQLYRLTAQANGDLITYPNTNNGYVPDPAPPSYAQYAQLVGEQNISYSLWNQYFIADSKFNYPSEAALQNDVFDNGGSPYDLFLSTNGWDFTTNDYYLNCWGAITTITNWTEKPMSVIANPQQGKLGGNGDSLFLRPTGNLSSDDPVGTVEYVSLPLAPYGSVSFGSAYWYQDAFNSGLEIYFQVWDYAYSSTASIISFTTHQHSCGSTDQTWVDPIYYDPSGNYRYTTPSIVTQSGSNPGAISVGVYLE